MIVLGVAVAGALGACGRFLLGELVRARLRGAFPWATFSINITGSFILGAITGAALYHGFGATPKAWLGTGFCGAYTTFSAWSLETVELLEAGDRRAALANVAVSTAAGLAAAAAGLTLAAL